MLMASRKNTVIKQSGVIPYLIKSRKVYIILVTARGNRDRWIIPKGHLEEEMTPAESAKLEAFEEAGVLGTAERKSVGTYKYSKFGNDYKVRLYPLKIKKILDEWPESGERSRRLLPLKQAVKTLADDNVRELVKLLPDFLKSRE